MGRHRISERVSSASACTCLVALVCALVCRVPLAGANPRRPPLSDDPASPTTDMDPRVDELEDAASEGQHDSEELRKTVLRGLGLKREPDVSNMNVSQEEYSRMYAVYLRAVEENTRRHAAAEQRVEQRVQRLYSFPPSSELAAAGSEHRHRTRRDVADGGDVASTWLYFPVDIPESRQGQQVHVEHATLRLFVSAASAATATGERPPLHAHVRVYQVLADFPGVEQRTLVDSKLVRVSAASSKWTDFDVTKAVQAWNADANADTPNLGLELECRDCERKGITLVTREASGSNSSVSPTLNLLAGVHLDGREKRSAGYDLLSVQDKQKEVCHKDGQKCCRHVMKVNFKDTPGLEYIIQPKEFDAGYCKGRCPPRYNPAHHHAVLQTLLRKQRSQGGGDGEKIPRVCCAPSRLRELEVLHLDEEDNTKLKMTTWDNMQVLECACS